MLLSPQWGTALNQERRVGGMRVPGNSLMGTILEVGESQERIGELFGSGSGVNR